MRKLLMLGIGAVLLVGLSANKCDIDVTQKGQQGDQTTEEPAE